LQSPHEFIIERSLRVELSIILCCWLEDYANVVGLWNTFVQENKRRYGWWLPFYDLEQYDTETINAADISYLTWHFLTRRMENITSPIHPFLLETGTKISALLDRRVDDLPGTDYYDKFFNIPDDVDFFDIKSKLFILALRSYLLALDFSPAYTTVVNKTYMEYALLPHSTLDKITYAMANEFCYARASSFLGWNAPRWLAETARCSDQIREQLCKMHRKLAGKFLMESFEGEQLIVRHLQTKRVFHINKTSASLDQIALNSVFATELVPWKNEWWISGMVAGDSADRFIDLEHTPPPAFYAYSEKAQNELRELEEQQRQLFMAYFGDSMVFYRNQRECEADMNQFIRRQNDNNIFKKFGAKGKAQNACPNPVENGVCMTYETGHGIVINKPLNKYMYMVSLPELPVNERREAYLQLLFNCTPERMEMINARLGKSFLQQIDLNITDIEKNLSCLHTVLNPSDFEEKTPKMVLNKPDL
jgi:hypothetical protein